jgi:8-oxo-dGTP pyrophosphatase MutT (NUDIX family)
MDVDSVRARLEMLRDRRADTLAVETLPITLREAAVLLLLWEQYGEVWLALTRRGPALRTHAGDVSLPGGVCEPGETAEDAAVREAVEEIGIDVRQTTVVGRLDDAWSSAGHRIVPVVAWHYGVPRFHVDGAEVSQVIELVVPELADPANHGVKTVPLGDIAYTDDVLRCSGVTIVGLTADIVVDLVHWLDGRDRRRVPERMKGLQYLVQTGRVQ